MPCHACRCCCAAATRSWTHWLARPGASWTCGELSSCSKFNNLWASCTLLCANRAPIGGAEGHSKAWPPNWARAQPLPIHLPALTACLLLCARSYACDPSARLKHSPDDTRLAASSEEVAAWFQGAGPPADGELPCVNAALELMCTAGGGWRWPPGSSGRGRRQTVGQHSHRQHDWC